jgi:hypothetical protein
MPKCSKPSRRSTTDTEYCDRPCRQIVKRDDVPLIRAKAGDRSSVICKPWMTVVIDASTRMIVESYIDFNPPSCASVMQALRGLS